MINVGILGCGRVVQNRYVEVFKRELNGIKVLLACDQVKEKAENVANILGCKAVYNYDQLFNSDDIDLILICTESGKHYNHSLQALKAGNML